MKIVLKSLICLLFISAKPVFAQEWGMASGVAAVWNVRQDYGKQDFLRLGYELPTFVYVPISYNFFARPGLRLGYSDGKPEMARGIEFREVDYYYAAELGIVYDWYVVPSLSFGMGSIHRTIRTKTSNRIEDSKVFDRKEQLGFWNLQFGLGIPVANGLIVMEPFYRHQSVKGDERVKKAVGLEFTVQYL